MTEAELVALEANLCNRFDAAIPAGDSDAHASEGSFLFAHNGVASAARQMRRLIALEPKTILEIGTGKGVGTIMLSRLADRVLTIDIGPYPLRQQIWDWDKAHNITQVLVTDDTHKSTLVADWLKFDMALIDADHSERGCKLDFDLVKACGAVLVHDYTPPYPNGPLALAESLPDENLVLDPPFFWWFADPLQAKQAREIK